MSHHRHSPEWRAVGASCAAAIACSAVAQVTWHVDDDCRGPGSGTPADPFCTIQDAIDEASDFDDVVVAPGTYFEAIDLSGKAISVRSAAGAKTTIIDATGLGQVSVVTCDAGEGPDTLLEGFTLTGGRGTDPGDGVGRGGGMYVVGSGPTIADCVFTGNTAARGGGMYDSNGEPVLSGCVFTANAATSAGGAMYSLSSSMTATGCTFTNNTVPRFDGGGLYVIDGTPSLVSCTFEGNTAGTGGGGAAIISSLAVISSCLFVENQTVKPPFGPGLGGGLALSGGSVTVHNCRFGGNAAGGGGGLFTNGTELTITNSVFSGNAADLSGGGLRSTGGCIDMINCTFTGNVAARGGAGIAVVNGALTATNCILWGDDPDEIDADRQATVTVSFSDVQGGAAGDGNIDGDPLFVDANGPDDVAGTPDDDLHLQDGSPCIDRGDDVAAGLPATDFDGEPRLQQCHVDIGADESPFFIDDDNNGIPDCTTCPWDCGPVADGDVGIVDFLALLAQWGGPGDCDSDGGGVGITDFLDLLANWGPCP